ncbi:nucleotidyltransferase domain-containing protein [Methanohalobium sp.]|uniref:type VII toxin-antitoxin system MntA family adenylyltransferase antitoxin n=1 Tax=Methanohalobium sp. TaxID=2837493 RepID=UPI0025DFDEDD|nr:nucleotidyltransferase domain-containing protein [Methanohalobium sp.]
MIEMEGKNTPSTEEIVTKLHDFFKHQSDVELAYLFGSAATSTRGKISDIDIGVYLSTELTKKQRNYRKLELISKLCTVLHTNDVDLVIINDASPVISFEIIKPNVPVFIKNTDFKIDVEQSIMSKYLDRQYHEQLMDKVFREKFKLKGFA